ncbi:unnamed protein product [Caenorhabditis angaria]|uniref:Kinesin-like protein n=1 Tax=Caenorhabditis angaria TaxID=860376 RepID=A0A9P1MXQ2_9PELO|nr:unnamed protein product [Caenorhabditis angaria]
METSLRVIVRARPMNAREMKEGAARCVEYFDATGQIVINGASTFAYDKVYPDTVDQETIYTQSAHPMLDHVFGGFNATILAYGQTGSGKTYTMGTEDSDGTDELRRGIIPRLVDNLFKRIDDSTVPEAYKVTVSMYEIYGDHIYDLLRPDKVKLTVHGDEKSCKIVNLTSVPVSDLKGALKQLEIGCHYRTKASTAMNAMSSRSHAVFTILLEKAAVPSDESSFAAKLQLVDLAGSERLKKTEAAGHVMREGISINGGLLILSQVITALVTKQSYVPYRTSALTRVLQDSLGGNSYTIFLACISPADTNAQETLSTLRYADRAKQIKNKPIINKNPKAEEISALRAQIKRLEKENSDLKKGIAPSTAAPEQISNTVEILALKDELIKKDEDIRNKCITLSDCIVRLNAVTNKNVRLESEKSKLATALTGVKQILENEEMLEPSDVIHLVSQLVGSEIETTLIGDDENIDETQVGMDESIYDAERLPELQTQLDAIEKEIALKDANREKELETQKEFIEAMQQREEERTQLAVKVGELEGEIAKLKNETRKVNVASKLAEERRQKVERVGKTT